MRSPLHLQEDQDGSALLEFVLVLPVLVMLGFSLIELAKIVILHQVMTSGVRDAARYVARSPNPDGAATAAANLATTATIDGTGSARITWWTAQDVTVSFSEVPNEDEDGEPLFRSTGPVRIVTVSTKRDYTPWQFVPMPQITLGAVHSERVIRE